MKYNLVFSVNSIKKTALFFGITLSCNSVFSQLRIQGATVVTRGDVHVVVNDLDYNNSGSVDGTASTFHFTGLTNTTIQGGTTNGFTNLEINKLAGKQLILVSPIKVTNNLAFVSGNIELNQNDIFLSDNGKLIGESEVSRVTGLSGGVVRAEAVLNEPNAVNIANLGAVITSTQNMGNVFINRGHQSVTIPAAGGKSIHRTFNITATNNISLSATLKLVYFDAELNGVEESSLGQFRSADNVNFTSNSFSARDAAANFVTQVNYATLTGHFTVSNAGAAAPLPVTFISFVAKCNNNVIQLTWQTANEQNSDRFDVQRSSNGAVWEKAGSLKSAGNSSSITGYQYDDKTLNAASDFYRLAQYDRDGKVAYSSVVKTGCSSTTSLSMVPNPVANVAKVLISASESNKDFLIMYDAAGREVMKRVVVVSPGTNQYELDMSTLPKGLYHLVLVKNGGTEKSIEIIKQ